MRPRPSAASGGPAGAAVRVRSFAVIDGGSGAPDRDGTDGRSFVVVAFIQT